MRCATLSKLERQRNVLPNARPSRLAQARPLACCARGHISNLNDREGQREVGSEQKKRKQPRADRPSEPITDLQKIGDRSSTSTNLQEEFLKVAVCDDLSPLWFLVFRLLCSEGKNKNDSSSAVGKTHLECGALPPLFFVFCFSLFIAQNEKQKRR
jgi:hypothetical protein